VDGSPNAHVRMSVLVLNPCGDESWGGVEKWMLQVATHLLARGHEVAACARPGSRWGEECQANALPTIPLPLRADFHPADIRIVRSAYHRRGVGVVLAKGRRCIRLAWASRLLLRPSPAIVGVIGGMVLKRSLRARLTYRHMADAYITPSEHSRRALLDYGYFAPERLHAIPNGIELPAEDPGARERVRQQLGLRDAPTLVVISRLHPDKGHSLLLKVVADLKRDFPELRVLIVGEGSERPGLERQAADLGLHQAVVFTGFRTDVLDLLRASDIFVLPSFHEGIPYAALEAMSVALPVVATAVGGLNELVVHGATGLLVPPGEPEPLKEALARVLRDPDLRREMGRAGLARVRENYTLDRMLERTEALLLGLHASRSPDVAQAR